MRILLTGATGFIGRHLAEALRLAGHEVRCAVRDIASAHRKIGGFSYTQIDFSKATEPAGWLPHLQNIDVVINAVGIFREHNEQSFAALHTGAPRALFIACAAMNIKRVIQISAHGAQQISGIEFLDSKYRADEFLLRQPLAAVVLLPAPIFGWGGASAEMFAKLAMLPVLPLPNAAQQLQPVHIDDICTAVLKLVVDDTRGRVAALGPQTLTLRDYLTLLRSALGYRRAGVVPVSAIFLTFIQRFVRSNWLDPEIQRMLEQSRIQPNTAFAALLDRAPLPPSTFIDNSAQWQYRLTMSFCAELLRYSLAILWIVSGVVSLWIFPRADSLELLARSGFGEPWNAPLLYAAGALDIALGIGIVVMRHTVHLRKKQRRWWLLQAAVIACYTAIITRYLPEFWAHPYGPVLKNLPILAAIALLYVYDSKRER